MTKKKSKSKAAGSNAEAPLPAPSDLERQPIVLRPEPLQVPEPVELSPGLAAKLAALAEAYPSGAAPTLLPPREPSIVWAIDPTWADRVERMADKAGIPPERFLESLLRDAWVRSPLKPKGAV